MKARSEKSEWVFLFGEIKMPIKSVPGEIREEFEKIANRLKGDHPDWSGEKRAKVTWGIIKKRYYKNDKGKWVLKKEVKGTLTEDIVSWLNLSLAKAIAKEEQLMDMLHGGEVWCLASAGIVAQPANFSIDSLQKTLKAAQMPMPPRKDPDLLFIKQRLLHTEPYVNANRFRFPVADTTAAVDGGQFNPEAGSYVDINHDGHIYGWTLGAEMEDRELQGIGMVKAVNVYMVFLAYRFPDEAEKIKKAHKEGNLGASMACHPESIECSKCNVTFTSLDAFIQHEHGAQMDAHLILHNPRFRASSIILPPFQPADKYTNPLSLAIMDDIFSASQKKSAATQEGNTVKTEIQSWVEDEKFDNILDYNELKREEKKDNTQNEITWDVMAKLRRITENALDKEGLENRNGVIKKAFDDAYNDLIAQLSVNVTSAEDEKMEKEKVETLEKENADLKKKVTAYEEEDRNKTLKEQTEKIEALEAEKKIAEAKVSTLEAEKDGLQAKVSKFDELQTSHDEMKAKIDKIELETKNADRKAKIEALKLEKAKEQEFIAKYELKVNEKGEITGKSDGEFESFMEAATLKSKEEEGGVGVNTAPESARVEDSKKLTIPAGGADPKDKKSRAQTILETGRVSK